MSWWERAACRGMNTELFYPGPGPHPGLKAKQICQTCPVATECLNDGIDQRTGVWGGTTRNDRLAIKRANG